MFELSHLGQARVRVVFHIYTKVIWTLPAPPIDNGITIHDNIIVRGLP